MQDPSGFPNPQEFQVFRFVDTAVVRVDKFLETRPAKPTPASKFTDVTNWNVWKLGV
jgi:hypothetical protein